MSICISNAMRGDSAVPFLTMVQGIISVYLLALSVLVGRVGCDVVMNNAEFDVFDRLLGIWYYSLGIGVPLIVIIPTFID